MGLVIFGALALMAALAVGWALAPASPAPVTLALDGLRIETGGGMAMNGERREGDVAQCTALALDRGSGVTTARPCPAQPDSDALTVLLAHAGVP